MNLADVVTRRKSSVSIIMLSTALFVPAFLTNLSKQRVKFKFAEEVYEPIVARETGFCAGAKRESNELSGHL